MLEESIKYLLHILNSRLTNLTRFFAVQNTLSRFCLRDKVCQVIFTWYIRGSGTKLIVYVYLRVSVFDSTLCPTDKMNVLSKIVILDNDFYHTVESTTT